MAEAVTVDPSPERAATSSSTALNLDGILLLEAPFAKVPFDELRRQQKTQQRLIERELQYATTTFSDATKPGGSRAGEVDKSLDLVLGRLKGLKRKLAPLAEQAKSSLRMAQSRTDHLANLHTMADAESVEFGEWARTRLDRMIVDYMLRRGYREAAHAHAAQKGIQDLVDVQLFDEIARIEDSLCPPDWHRATQHATHEVPTGVTRPSCGAALAWCSENKATLRKIRTPLEFNLRMQEFIELARVRTSESIRDAIAYARRHLLPLVTATKLSTAASEEAEYERLAAEAIRKEVSRALGLLACAPGSWAYADLYSVGRWAMLRDSFRACALQIHSLPAQPILHIALSAGLSSLKLPQCCPAVGDGGNVDCPVCDAKGLGVLARQVPWSHHQNSTLVCSVSGNIMDDNDPPLALPNGRVYAQSTIVDLVHKGDGCTIVCPRTGARCSLHDVRKLFIS
jgi:macrophage erythroblast attacher